MSNNPPLTRPSVTAPTGSPDGVLAPGVPNGFPGNWTDDDAIALDEQFEAADHGPEEYGGLIPVQDDIRVNTRIITRWLTMNSGFDGARMNAIQALPSDHNRRRIIVSAVGIGGAGFFLAGPEPFSLLDNSSLDITSAGQFAVYCPALIPQTFVIEEHTGALWIACNVSAAAMLVSTMSVTC